MAISNASSGFRPGVCTSTTRPVSPFNGQVIYETDTKQTLVWQGTTWVMLTDADTPPGLQHIRSVSFTNTSTIEIDSCFSSEFRNYKLLFSLRPNATATGGVELQLRASGSNLAGSSYITQGVSQNAGNAPSANNGSATTGFYLTNFYSATDFSVIAEATILNPNQTAWTGYFGTSAFDWPGPQYFTRTQNGFYTQTTAADGFRLVTTSAITGNVRIYGLRD